MQDSFSDSTRPGLAHQTTSAAAALLLLMMMMGACATANSSAPEVGGTNCDACADGEVCSADGECVLAVPYPDRGDFRLKGIQPDFWPMPAEIAGNNAGGVALNLVWAFWEPERKAPPCDASEQEYDGHCFTIDVAVDAAVRDWTERGLVVTAVVYGVPAWARTTRPCSPAADGFDIFCAPDDAQDYARFAGMLAMRYDGLGDRGRIADFVIHNEVNSNTWFDVGCGQGVPCDSTDWIETYAANFNAAYDAIVTRQPTARVLVSLDHHFDDAFDLPSAEQPLLSGKSLLRGVAARAGAREWRVAYHPYPPDLLAPQFGPDDLPKVTYGNLGVLAGFLRTEFPERPSAWEIHLTESGVNSAAPSTPEAQAQALCDSFRNVLGTPGVVSYVYHRMTDNPDELAAGLAVGLRNQSGAAKPAWDVWALANRNDLDPPQLSCGFEDLPLVRLTRSVSAERGHWASTRTAPAGFTVEASWLIHRHPQEGAVPLFECAASPAGQRHNFLTADPDCEGAQSLGPVGYVFQEEQPGTRRMFRCRVDSSGDQFVSLDANCEGQAVEKLLGYVPE